MSHSGEEVTIGGLLGNPVRGRYLDIGANQPQTSSNTWPFYQAGWSGLCVDPLPGLVGVWRDMRPHDTFVECAVGARDGLCKLQVAGSNGELSFVEAAPNGNVPMRTVDSLMAEHWPPDEEITFASIDVEGSEHGVLTGWDLGRWRPRLLCIEATKPGTNIWVFEDWDHLLVRANYLFARTDGANRYYLAG